MRNVVSFIIVCFCLTSCQTYEGPIRSTVYDFDYSRSETKEALIETFIGAGYTIVSDSEYQMVFDQPSSSLGIQVFYGSDYDRKPNRRITLVFTGDNPTKVTTQAAIVTNPGSGFERKNDFTQNPAAREAIYQRMLSAQQTLDARSSS